MKKSNVKCQEARVQSTHSFHALVININSSITHQFQVTTGIHDSLNTENFSIFLIQNVLVLATIRPTGTCCRQVRNDLHHTELLWLSYQLSVVVLLHLSFAAWMIHVVEFKHTTSQHWWWLSCVQIALIASVCVVFWNAVERWCTWSQFLNASPFLDGTCMLLAVCDGWQMVSQNYRFLLHSSTKQINKLLFNTHRIFSSGLFWWQHFNYSWQQLDSRRRKICNIHNHHLVDTLFILWFGRVWWCQWVGGGWLIGFGGRR